MGDEKQQAWASRLSVWPATSPLLWSHLQEFFSLLFPYWAACMDRASVCGSVQLVILLSGSRVLESLCHPQRLLVLEGCWYWSCCVGVPGNPQVWEGC